MKPIIAMLVRAVGVITCLLIVMAVVGRPSTQASPPIFALTATPLQPGAAGLIKVILKEAPAGLQTVTMKITLDTLGIVQIVGVDKSGLWSMKVLQQSTTSVEFTIVDLLDVVRAGTHEAPLVQIRLMTLAVGETKVTLLIERFQDDRGGEVSPSSLSISLRSGTAAQPANLPELFAQDVTMSVGEETQEAITLAVAPGGMQSADIVLSIQDPMVAQFVDIAPGVLHGNAFTILTKSPNTIRLHLVATTDQIIAPGAHDQALATLTLEGLEAGQTQLIIQVVTYVDQHGETINPQTHVGQITVTPSSTTPPPSTPQPPVPPAPTPQPPSSPPTLVLTGSSPLAPQAQGVVNLILSTAPQGCTDLRSHRAPIRSHGCTIRQHDRPPPRSPLRTSTDGLYRDRDPRGRFQ